MKITCFGDSLTYGKIGYSYIKYLPHKKIVNRGVNGDTVICTYKRLKNYVESQRNDDTDVYIIAIGINDLLLPFLTTVSRLWKIQMTPRVKLKECIKNDSDFKNAYEKYITLLLLHKKKMVLVGLPLLELSNFPNKRIEDRNRMIKELAEMYQVPFVDTYKLMKREKTRNTVTNSWKCKNVVRIIDALIMIVFPFSKDVFSRIRNLELTVDGVHYNSKSASLIANAINQYL